MGDEMSDTGFVVVVPVKPLAQGKSRLVGIAPAHRRALAEAFVRDTVAAALATATVSRVVVVTDDVALALSLREEHCLVLPDGVAGDLNASLVQAAAEARRRWPDLRPVVVCADLPALTPDALSAALRATTAAAPDGAAFVPDLAGRGTTVYTAPHAVFAPRFGTDSRTAHLEAGAVEVADVPDRVRQDVDVMSDLGRVLLLGVGVHTERVSGRS